MNKKTTIILIVILILAGVLVWMFYYDNNSGSQGEGMPVAMLETSGVEVGSVSEVSDTHVSVVGPDKAENVYLIGQETLFFRMTKVAPSGLSKGETAVVAVQPATGSVFSVNVFKNKADAPANPEDQNFVFSGSVDSASANELKIVDSKGVSKTFNLTQDVEVLRIEKITASSVQEGDKARASWYAQDGAIRAGAVFVLAE